MMTMKVIDRVLLTLMMLLVIAVCAAVVLAAWQVIPKAEIFAALEGVYGSWLYSLCASLIALIVLVVAVKLLFLRIPSAVAEPMERFAIRGGDAGDVSISAKALEEMILKHGKANENVRDCQCAISRGENGIAIALRVVIMPGANLVEVSQQLQTDVKQAVETLSGLSVTAVTVTFDTAPQQNGAAAPRTPTAV